MSENARRVRIIALLLLGAALWFAIGNGRGIGTTRAIIVAGAFALGLIPTFARMIARGLDRLRNPSPRTIELTTLIIGIAATSYFVFTAFHQQRDLFPKTHDEGSYLLGMQMLAHGRLWMPRHELADFFDTFYVIVNPVYASLYFPGTALMYAPSIWLNWPTWILPVVASGIIVALLYRVVTQLMDGVAGLLAAALMMSLSWFRMLSILLFSQVPMLLLGLLMVWAWLRWRQGKRVGWLIAIGIFAGWGAITRPIDALCYAIPVGAAIAWDLRRTSPRHLTLAGVCLIAGAIPFLSLQLIFNKGITGTLLKTPYTFYLERDQPQTSFGFHKYDPTLEPQSKLAQKRRYYETFMKPQIERHQIRNLLGNWIARDQPGERSFEHARLGMFVDTTMPFRFLLPFALVGAMGLSDIRRRVLWLPLPLLIMAYLPNTFFLEHYAIVAAPAVILSLILAVEEIARSVSRWSGGIRASLTLGLLATALFGTRELNPEVDDETFPSPMLQFVNLEMPQHVQTPAVVLFRYRPGDNVIEEPVYNNAAPWPDDEPIIRAHDLGERNIEIFRYYAAKQPQRTFYLFDRANQTLTRLGTALELVQKHSP